MPDQSNEIDMRHQLAGLSIRQLLGVANAALNRLTIRDLHSVFYEEGVSIEIEFADKREAPDA
jgi:hypothetical protein